MSIQAYSYGTLPDYFLNLQRKASMTEEEIKKERKQLEKLYINNCMTEENKTYHTEKRGRKHVYHYPSN